MIRARLIWVSAAAGSAGIWGNGLPYANRAVRISREKSLAAILPHALQAQASQLVGRSQFDLAYASAEEGYRLAFDLGLPWAASWALADLATVDALRGDEERARLHLAELAPLSASSGAWSEQPRRERSECSILGSAAHPRRLIMRLCPSVPCAQSQIH